MSVTLLMVIGVVIIAVLAFYAAYLLMLVYRQKRDQERKRSESIVARNDILFEHVAALCTVGLQGQCDFSEICIRICRLLICIRGDMRVDITRDFPAIAELYAIVKDMARGDDRQVLTKAERMQQTMARMKAESRLSQSISSEMLILRQKVLKSKSEQVA